MTALTAVFIVWLAWIGVVSGTIVCSNGLQRSWRRVIGRPVRDVLGLNFDEDGDPVGTVLEWGVRALGKNVEVNAEGDLPARATADLFPAYDDDGGMLLVLTPAK